MFIWDMCTCLDYPNYGCLNQDARCNGSQEKLEMVLSYSTPITHDPDQRRVWNSSKKSQDVPRCNVYEHSQVKYSAL